jgi:N-hydroxyarylamine O-acetyltransferase
MRHPELDLEAYLARIDHTGTVAPTDDCLAQIQQAHLASIPFENLDILLRKPLRLDLAGLVAKLVDSRRGGYCFEQNALLAAVLERIGFSVTRLAARVRVGKVVVRPRNHMLLGVQLGRTLHIADVGFGVSGPFRPLPLVADREETQAYETFRFVLQGAEWVYQSRTDTGWQDLYSFTLEPWLPVDFEPCNWYTSTHPSSRFTQILCVQRVLPGEKRLLVNQDYESVTAERTDTRTVVEDADVLATLSSDFGLAFPEGTRFRYPATGLLPAS